MLIMSETRRQKIDRLRALLESGVSSDSTDGASTTFDLDIQFAVNWPGLSARRVYASVEAVSSLPNMTRR